MSYLRHHSIVVTSWDEQTVTAAQSQACSLFPWVSPISPATLNGYRSFFIPSDGSKEGWPESDEGDKKRAAFITWLKEQKNEDGSSSLDWAEVQYADDCGKDLVLQSCRYNHPDKT